jgi:hypothetical protein
MMAEGDGLGRLQMGEARHDRAACAPACFTSARCSTSNPAEARAQASRTHSRKSVATWSLRERAVCSRAPAGPTISVSRASMLKWMSSSSRLKAKRPAAISRRSGRARHDRVRIGLADDALGGQHPGMRLRARDIVIGEAFVEIDGDVYLLHDPGGAALEAPAPHLVRRHRLNRCLIFALVPVPE